MNIKTRCVNNKKEIFDSIRRRFVALTEEELVRQAYLNYLQEELQVPRIAISVEKKITYNQLTKRYDIAVCDPKGAIVLLVECKAENVKICEDTFLQATVYNTELQSKYIVLFNGKQQYVYQQSPEGYIAVDSLPMYKQMILK